MSILQGLIQSSASEFNKFFRFPEEINILVLGQSGVGKSTFISSVANYLMHKTFEDSMEGELKILVRFYATMTDELVSNLVATAAHVVFRVSNMRF